LPIQILDAPAQLFQAESRLLLPFNTVHDALQMLILEV